MNGLSLFANVGIAETYLEQVGVDIVVANELLPNRARFYEHLHPECNMICGDITDDTVYQNIIDEQGIIIKANDRVKAAEDPEKMLQELEK